MTPSLELRKSGRDDRETLTDVVAHLRQRYFAEGIRIGALTGGTTGAVLGYVLERYQWAPTIFLKENSPFAPTFVGALVGLVLGANIGAGLGALLGNRYGRKEAERREGECSGDRY